MEMEASHKQARVTRLHEPRNPAELPLKALMQNGTLQDLRPKFDTLQTVDVKICTCAKNQETFTCCPRKRAELSYRSASLLS
jgi:hypothetical protein